MALTDQREVIAASLAGFDSRPLTEAAVALFETLGYNSERRLALQPNTVATFLSTFDQRHSLPADPGGLVTGSMMHWSGRPRRRDRDRNRLLRYSKRPR